MNPTILEPNYATRIRSRLGVTEAHLSVEEIDEVLPEIEAEYKDLFPDYASLEGNAKIYLHSSIVCRTASALCSLLTKKFPISEKGPSGSFEYTVDWSEEGRILREKSVQFLSKLIPSTQMIYFKVV